MTTRTLTGTYSAGYSLRTSYSTAKLTSTALIEGSGLIAKAAVTLTNQGAIAAGTGTTGNGHLGMTLEAASRVVNAGAVMGGRGANGGSYYSIYGTYAGNGGKGGAGIDFVLGGTLTNEGSVSAGPGGDGGYGVYAPGSGGDGGDGVRFGANGMLVNKGTITGGMGGGAGDAYFGFGPNGAGGAGVAAAVSVDLKVVNTGVIQGGATPVQGAASAGAGGAGLSLGGGTVINSGLIAGAASYYGESVASPGGAGIVTQSAAMISNTGGSIVGGQGSDCGGYATAYGVGGNGGDGVDLLAGGSIVNKATIEGGQGGKGADAIGGEAAAMGGSGGDGVALSKSGNILNLGVIVGGEGGAGGTYADSYPAALPGHHGDGALLAAGGSVTNGTASVKSGVVISGDVGVLVSGSAAATVTNFATILGDRFSVEFESAKDVLIAESGAQFVGAITGGGGTFELAGGTGTISGVGFEAVVTGTDSASLEGFSTYDIGKSSRWTMDGTNSLAASQSLLVRGGVFIVSGGLALAAGAHVSDLDGGIIVVDASAGFLANAGTIIANGSMATIRSAVDNTGKLVAENDATLAVQGAVTGTGVVDIQGGTLSLGSSFNENVTFTTATPSGTLVLARSRSYAGTVFDFSASGATSLDLRDIAFASAGQLTFAGTSAGGVLTVTDGTHIARIALRGDYLGSTFSAAKDGHGGVVITDRSATASLIQAISSFRVVPSIGMENAPAWEASGRPTLVAHR